MRTIAAPGNGTEQGIDGALDNNGPGRDSMIRRHRQLLPETCSVPSGTKISSPAPVRKGRQPEGRRGATSAIGARAAFSTAGKSSIRSATGPFPGWNPVASLCG